MRSVAWLAVAVVVLGIAALALPQVVPAAWLRDRLTAALATATGGDVRLAGSIRWRLLPRIGARVEGVELRALPDLPMVRRLAAEAVEVDLRVGDLLRGVVAPDRVVVTGLDLDLDLAAGTPVAAGAADSPPGAPTTTSSAVEAPARRVGDLRLVDGRVTVVDGARVWPLRDVTGHLTSSEPDAALALSLQARLDDRAVALTLDAGSIAALRAGRSAPLTFGVHADGLDVRFEGTVTGPTAAGHVHLTATPPAAVLGWLARTGLDLPGQRLELTAETTAGPTGLAATGLVATLDDGRAAGDLHLDLAGPRPRLSGALALDVPTVPARPAPSGTTTDGTVAPAGEPAAAGAAPSWPAPTVPLDDERHLQVERLALGHLVVGPGALRLTGADGDAVVAIDHLAVEGGAMDGTVAYRPRQGVAGLSGSLRAAGVALRPALQALAGTDAIAGSLDLTLEAAAAGRSAAELVASLDGVGALTLTSARLFGLERQPHLDALARLAGLGGGSPGELALGEVRASFTVEDGLVANDDLVASTPLLRVAGAGTVDLPGRRVPRYVLTPEPAVPLDRLGAPAELRTLLVPVVLEGSFDDLRARPDAEAAIGEALRRLLDRPTGTPPSEVERAIEDGVGQLLRGLRIRP